VLVQEEQFTVGKEGGALRKKVETRTIEKRGHLFDGQRGEKFPPTGRSGGSRENQSGGEKKSPLMVTQRGEHQRK